MAFFRHKLMQEAKKFFYTISRAQQHIYQVFFRITADDNDRITADGNTRITANSDY